MSRWNDRQRWAAVVGLVVSLYALSRLAVPYQHRYGRYVFETRQCPAPIVRMFQPRNRSGVGQGVCWASAANHVGQGAVLLVLAIIGTAAAVRLLRDSVSDSA